MSCLGCRRAQHTITNLYLIIVINDSGTYCREKRQNIYIGRSERKTKVTSSAHQLFKHISILTTLKGGCKRTLRPVLTNQKPNRQMSNEPLISRTHTQSPTPQCRQSSLLKSNADTSEPRRNAL